MSATLWRPDLLRRAAELVASPAHRLRAAAVVESPTPACKETRGDEEAVRTAASSAVAICVSHRDIGAGNRTRAVSFGRHRYASGHTCATCYRCFPFGQWCEQQFQASDKRPASRVSVHPWVGSTRSRVLRVNHVCRGMATIVVPVGRAPAHQCARAARDGPQAVFVKRMFSRSAHVPNRHGLDEEQLASA